MMIQNAPNGELYPRREQFMERLASRHQPYLEGNTIRIPTDVILQTHEVAIVSVDGGAYDERYVLGDGGQILRSLDLQNFTITSTVKRAIERVAKSRGMRLAGTSIVTDAVGWEQVIPYVPYVADVMRECLSASLSKVARHDRLLLRHRIGEMLNRISGEANVTQDYKMQGSTSDSYKFDFSVLTSNHHRFLLDAPIPDPSSIAATLLRQADVRLLGMSNLRQMITYDPNDRWPSSNLAQLQLANVPLINVEHLEAALHA